MLSSDNDRDPITKMKQKTYYKRPDWNKIFRNLVNAKHEDGSDYLHKGNVGVFYCGTPLAMPAINGACTRFSNMDRCNFRFHRENF